jgi:DNA (cytosine-5)-methyltransferase 1
VLTHGSLFSGVGGMDLGFERAGIKTLWQVEVDEHCRGVLGRHFPDAERFVDVREVGERNLKPVDIISGGFPCQDISVAGAGRGLAGERSGLWAEMRRIVCELRPRFVVVENVSALLYRGIGRVLGDLAAGGYDAEWDCLPACAFGAPHRRERVFLVAYPNGFRFGAGGRSDIGDEVPYHQEWSAAKNIRTWAGWQRWIGETFQNGNWAETDPEVLGMDDGIPNRVERIHALGNSIVPQIAEWIGKRIVEVANEGTH